MFFEKIMPSKPYEIDDVCPSRIATYNIIPSMEIQ
jgi:hypothetical protein